MSQRARPGAPVTLPWSVIAHQGRRSSTPRDTGVKLLSLEDVVAEQRESREEFAERIGRSCAPPLLLSARLVRAFRRS